MSRNVFWIALCFLTLAGCANTPTPPSVAPIAWQDEAFGYDAALVTVKREDLFHLDPQLAQQLRDPALDELGSRQRIERLLELIFGKDKKPFPYWAGHSTVASETWRQKRGDCLSLTVLAYAMARAINMTPDIQEVKVPVLLERRRKVDFFNHHVNVLFRNTGPLNPGQGGLRASDIIVDFEPEIGSFRHGQTLSENAVLARYYNNIAAEQLANGELRLAYAHFRAAIVQDPGYAPSYSNLAALYARFGLQGPAEQLLRHAIALGDAQDAPLASLHQLLVAQNRHAEAQEYEQLLAARRESDPYYWIGLGVELLQERKYQASIQALEKARSMSRGFEEIHQYLALAYWRAGQAEQAREQLGQLAALQGTQNAVASLTRKFNASPP